MLAWRFLAVLLAVLALFAFAARVLDKRGLRLRRIDVQVVAWRLGGLLLGAALLARMLLEPLWPGSGPLLAAPVGVFCLLAGVLGGEAAVPSAERPRRGLLAVGVGVTAVTAIVLAFGPWDAAHLLLGAVVGLGWAGAGVLATRRRRWTVVTLAAAGLMAATALAAATLTAGGWGPIALGLVALVQAGWLGAAVAAPNRPHFQRPAA